MLIKPFKELGKGDAAIAGGKGASLGEMTQAGVPVPPGYVVLSTTFDRFLAETDLTQEIEAVLHTVNREEMHTVEHASEKIQQMILEAKMPEDIAQDVERHFKELGAEFVAVRSSATAEDSASAAWAGQLDSYLNTTDATLLKNVQRCWASLFTPRAIFYRFEKELHTQKISVAVVVQKMVASEVSGIAFSVHPVTEDRNQLIIEAGFGLGEAIVSGQVTPDSYVVEKSPRKIIDTNVSTQTRALYRAQGGGNEWRDIAEPQASAQVLTNEQVLELSELVLKIENHYTFPCDIEWAFESGRFYIVQSRPITTLSPKKSELPISFEKDFTRESSLFEAVVWRDANVEGEKQYVGENTEEIFLMRPDNRDILEIWYSRNEFRRFDRLIEECVRNDPSWFQGVVKDFKEHWEHLCGPLAKRTPLTLQELEAFHHHLLAWWGPMALMFVIPNDPKLPEDVRQEALKLREETQELSDRTDEICMISIEKIYPEMAKYAWVLLPSEVLVGKLPPETELKQRREGWYMTNNSFGLIADLPQELAQKNWELKRIHTSDTKEIKGQTAHAGKVKGVVKVVLTKKEIVKVETGDILVTPMTNPEYVPYMQKAAAFVTDEGGLTCHAAIVARELKTPCIVGTKFATQILKDGMQVEVDADNGVVRILGNSADERIEKIKAAEWQQDWKATYPLFQASLDDATYLGEFQKIFGKSLSQVLVLYKDNIAYAWLPTKEYEELGNYLASKAFDTAYLTAWLERFKELSDQIMLAIKKPPAEIAKKFEEFKLLYQRYGANQVATKLTFNFLPPGNEKIGEKLEAARKYSETFYHDCPILFKELPGLLGIKEEALPAGIYYDKDGLHQLSSAEVAEIERYWQAGAASNELRGQSAYPGKVRGVCRVVHDYETEIKEGEILVTTMTSPYYVPMMKRAAAIVTDAGGMLSHAAIVARELKTPCIVGTKFATQILKDGDMVEVDADSGVVRLLEKGNMPDYQQIEFVKNIYPLDVYVFELGWSNAEKRTDLNLVPLEVILVFKNGDFTLYCDNIAWQENARRAFLALVHSATLRETLAEKSKDYIQRIQESIAWLKNRKYSSLAEAHQRTHDLLYECILAFAEENFTGLNSSILTDELHKLVPDSALAAELLNPRRQSYFQKYDIALLAAASTIESKEIKAPITFEQLPKDVQKELDSIIETYGWIVAGFNEKPKNSSALVTELNDLLATGVSAKKIEKERQEQFTSTLKKRKEVEKELQKKLSAADWEKVTLVQSLVEEAKYRIELALEFIYASRDLYQQIAQKYGLPLTEFKYLFPEEVGKLLKEEMSITDAKERIHKRSSKEFVFSIKSGITHELSDFTPPQKEETMLKGQKAYGGVVKGIVKIVNSPEENHKVTTEDILVSSRTSPELVPAMAKARAIVSELGGMLCHAAIVSREMKKTCLVGVKRATELLHDGDLVEVDADQGVVRIIT